MYMYIKVEVMLVNIFFFFFLFFFFGGGGGGGGELRVLVRQP